MTRSLSPRQGGTLAALLGLLVVYEAGASRLPELPENLEPFFYALVVLPSFAGAIWLALPLARARTVQLLALALAAGALAAALTLVDVDSVANVAKLACYALAGFTFLSLFEELWWVALVALLVPWVDIWSVSAGPTEYVVERQPGLFEDVAISFPTPGESAVIGIGPPDILFFALFLAAADRFDLRVRATWIGMTACLGLTLILVWYWEDVGGLPALPAVCLGFLAPNVDLIWRDVRRARPTATG